MIAPHDETAREPFPPTLDGAGPLLDGSGPGAIADGTESDRAESDGLPGDGPGAVPGPRPAVRRWPGPAAWPVVVLVGLLSVVAVMVVRGMPSRPPSRPLPAHLLPPQAGRAPSGQVPSGRPSSELPSGQVPAGEVPAGEVPVGSVPAGRTPAGQGPGGAAGAAPVGAITVSCGAPAVIHPGHRITLSYQVTSGAAGSVGLGAGLYDDDGSDDSGDADATPVSAVTAGTTVLTRSFSVPADLRPGRYELTAEIWPPTAIDEDDPLAEATCAVLTV